LRNRHPNRSEKGNPLSVPSPVRITFLGALIVVVWLHVRFTLSVVTLAFAPQVEQEYK
jgi:hypothetical protein